MRKLRMTLGCCLGCRLPNCLFYVFLDSLLFTSYNDK